MTSEKRPLIGFFPVFGSMGEVIPLVRIAKEYLKAGGQALFFSHNRTYEYLAEEIGCRIVRLRPIAEERQAEIEKAYNDGVPWETILLRMYDRESIARAVEEELAAFKEAGVEMIVSAFMLTSHVSARVLKIPLVVVASGTALPPVYQAGHATFPEDYENIVTRLLPQPLKDRFATWYLLHNRRLSKEFNKVAASYGLPRFRSSIDVMLGDETLICDDMHFLGVRPSAEFPEKNYIGPIISRTLDQEGEPLEADIVRHLKRPGRSIILAMGSAYSYRDFLPRIIEALNTTDYNVIAVYKTKKPGDVPVTAGKNILIKEYVPLDRVLQKTDLAITHGGRGTVYTVAYSGKPAICIPIIYEQQINIDNLVRAGSGLRLSKRTVDADHLLKAIATVFDHYDEYSRNAQGLARRLTKEPGETTAVRRLLEIYQSIQQRQLPVA